MIRVAALLCACTMALAACYGGSRAVIVRTAAPVVPVCLDASRPGTPAAQRICPLTPAEMRAIARRVGATQLRASADADPLDLRRDPRRDGRTGEVSRDAYVDELIRRRTVSATTALLAPDAALATAYAPAVVPVPTARSVALLRGSVN